MMARLCSISSLPSLLSLLYVFALTACTPEATHPQQNEAVLASGDQSFKGDSEERTLGGLSLFGDTNRDGIVNQADLEGRALWSWTRGALILANLDDDDRDGLRDAEDERINGDEDLLDLAELKLRVESALLERGGWSHIEVLEGAGEVNLFAREEAHWKPLVERLPLQPERTLAIEAHGFADGAWDGRVTLRATVTDDAGALLAEDIIRLRVAPWLMLPAAAPATEIHVATGVYQNEPFLEGLKAATERFYATLHAPHETQVWQEMWMQDTMEVGYTQLPGRLPLSVVLGAPRGADRYPPTLLGPDMGYLSVGTPRGIGGGDDWVDWYGNLEVTLPTERWPLGRIYYGLNPESGVGLHPKVVAFLEAQELQAPTWIDTGWLTIKHVDEILNFIDGPEGPALVVMSPREAGILYPDAYGEENQEVQKRIDRILHGGEYVISGERVERPGLLAELGLSERAAVPLPLFYSEGHNRWSNPVNSLLINGGLVIGETDYWPAEREVITERLEALGLTLHWIDDAVYQYNKGNVHCATNATRLPFVERWERAIPGHLSPSE